jgi:precorrin-6B methylase 2
MSRIQSVLIASLKKAEKSTRIVVEVGYAETFKKLKEELSDKGGYEYDSQQAIVIKPLPTSLLTGIIEVFVG